MRLLRGRQHTHQWARCRNPLDCRHMLPAPHWACIRCGEGTDSPPGESVLQATQVAPPPHEPDWIVVRQGPNLPHTLMPPELDGLWVDRTRWAAREPEPGAIARTVPTGRFEDRMRPDGEVEIAEVYELEPVDPDFPGR